MRSIETGTRGDSISGRSVRREGSSATPPKLVPPDLGRRQASTISRLFSEAVQIGQAVNTSYLVNPEWLSLVDEPAIEPGRPICDPHHHLWDRPGNRYLAEELTADLRSGHNIVSTVFVECGAAYRVDGHEALKPLGETEFVVHEHERAAAMFASPTNIAAGIVGFADLRAGVEVDKVLAAHIDVGAGRFRGIRHAAATNADPEVSGHRIMPALGLLGDAEFRAGFSCLHAAGLSFEAWLYHPQLQELCDLAKAFPETSIMLNHVGGPLGIGSYANDRAAVFSQWSDAIALLAKCKNVHVKLGGLGMELCGFGWERMPRPPSSEEFAAAIEPFVGHCIDCFGVERSMFESNFPVDKTSCSYGVLWNAFKRLARSYTATERDALFYDSAARFYRLDDLI